MFGTKSTNMSESFPPIAFYGYNGLLAYINDHYRLGHVKLFLEESFDSLEALECLNPLHSFIKVSKIKSLRSDNNDEYCDRYDKTG